MEKIESVVNRWILPITVKLNNWKSFIAVRDAFLQILPFTLVGSFAVLLNNVILSSSGFIGQFLVKLIPTLDEYQKIFSPILTGTTTIMSIFIVYLVSRNYAKLWQADTTKAGLTAIAVYFIFYPSEIALEDGNFFTMTYFGAQGLFVAIIVGLVVGWLFSKLTKSERMKIKMPEQVPPEISNSFSVVLPVMLILVGSSVLNFLIIKIDAEGINHLIYNFIQSPMNKLGASIPTLFILDFIAQFLWSFGIHGASVVFPITKVLYGEANIVNLEYVAKVGHTMGAPYPFTWLSIWENYGTIGGSGNTLGLVLAILILSYRSKKWRRQDYTDIAKMAFFPGIFGINEPVIFGLPIVLNPILMIPFILSPLVNMGIGVLEIALGMIPPGVLDSGWTTPQPIKEFLASSGAWQSIVSQVVALIVATLIYLPFVLVANNTLQIEKEMEG